jgi:hypothetical protein
MKKIALLLTMIFTFTILLPSFASAADMPLRVVVNGNKTHFPDAQPFVDEQGRTQVPSRFIAEALGATTTWNAKEQKASFVVGENKLELTIGNKNYLLNGHTYRMDTEAMVQNERTYVPARYVAEAFGAEVVWDKAVWTVYIQLKPGATPKPSTIPIGGTTKVYDGISFNDVTDVDQEGRVVEEKLMEFTQKLANQITFVKENGKYVIKVKYPKLPEGFRWSIRIDVETEDDIAKLTPIPMVGADIIPNTGSFTKVVPFVNDGKDIRLYRLYISVDRTEHYDNIGNFTLTKTSTGILRAAYVPDSGEPTYYKNFNFNRMFQW